MILAIMAGLKSMVKYLVEKGATIEAVPGGPTPLYMAVLVGNESIVRYLVEEGADYKTANKNGETPLSVAKRKGHKGVVAYLEGLRQE